MLDNLALFTSLFLSGNPLPEDMFAFKDIPWPEDDPSHPMHLMHITEKTYNQIGLSLISDTTACELLAFTFEFGPECCVLDKKLNYVIRLAQKKLNLYGGEIPNAKMLPLLQEKLHDVCGFHAGFISNGREPSLYVREKIYPDWLVALGDRYAFRLPSPTTDSLAPPEKKKPATLEEPFDSDKRKSKSGKGKITFKYGKLGRS